MRAGIAPIGNTPTNLHERDRMMALYVESMGWQDHEETGEKLFRIVLVADQEDDIPGLTVDVVWGRKEVALVLATDLPE